MDTLTISEVFGPTVQGEGPSTGRRAAFVRLGRCNLDCCWCDTPYTWDWRGKNGRVYNPAEELRRVPVTDVVEEVCDMGTPLVVVTGGEPLLQLDALAELCALLRWHGKWVEIETNGTRPPVRLSDARFNVSPKLANSGIPSERRTNPAVLQTFGRLSLHDRASFKFVVQNPDELDEVATLVAIAGAPATAVWVMPEGRTVLEVEERTRALADAVIDRGWNLSGRMHVAIWGDERGH